MKRKLGIILGVGSLAALAVVASTRPGVSQRAPNKLVIGIYAPTVEFGTSAARLQYLQGLARAVQNKVGTEVNARSYTSYSQLKRANVDFAIIDGQCYAANPGAGQLLANAKVGGRTQRPWALYSSVGPSMQGLRGKKLAYVKTGCRDNDFLANAMLDSEVGLSFFSGRVGKPDLGGAVAEVASYKGAQAVFAPVGAQKGLTKVFDTGSVPNPAFVQLNSKLSDNVVGAVRSAVVSYGGGGAIGGWSAADAGDYRALRSSMGRRVKRGEFAFPGWVRVDSKGVLQPPSTLDDAAFPDVGQHFQKPPERQQ